MKKMICRINNNRVFDVVENLSILDSAKASGVHLSHGCLDGKCGACRTKLLKGEIREIKKQMISKEDLSNGYFYTCCCSPASDIEIDAEDLPELKNILCQTVPVKIDQMRLINTNILEVVLRMPPKTSFRFIPGQYIKVINKKNKRSYSIASSNRIGTLTLIIKKVSNGYMSDYWFNKAKKDDLLRIEGPFGSFFIRNNSKKKIFLATGVGIAPFLSIINSLSETFLNDKIELIWGSKSKSEFFKIKYRKESTNLVMIESNTNTSNLKKFYIQDYAIENFKDIDDIEIYACGNPNMINSAKKLFVGAGLPESSFFSDAFIESN